MTTFIRSLIFATAFAAIAAAQPVVTSVLNASSYQADIARGSWFVVFGSNMGPANIVLAPGSPFPAEL